MKANQKTKHTPKEEKKRPPETIEERVHRHISDINSKITDEDIKSVKTELDIRRNAADDPQEEDNANKKQKKNVQEKETNNDQSGDAQETE